MTEGDMIGPKSNEKSWRLGFVVGFALVTPSAFADEAAPPDAQAVVVRQLQAFERDDAAQAWSYAAPEVREKFVSAANFLGAVREKYGPIYRHRSVDFGPAARKGDEVGMVVTLVDRDNEVWSALFVVSRQADGQWKTAGCLLAKAPQASV
jgi:hypothetical protein